MAIYHCSYKVGSKGKGHSASAKADYILRDGKYSAEAAEVLHSESGNMPGWARENPRSFWKATDAQSLKNARLFCELEFALPNEMTPEQQVDLARDFAHKVTQQPCGEDVTLPYTLAIHRGGRQAENVHSHMVFSDRGNDGLDRDPERWFKRANKKEPAKGGAAKIRGIKDKDWLTDTKANWAAVANHHLEQGGYPDRIDHRSLADQGINRIPQIHKGPNAVQMDAEGLPSDRVDRWRQINMVNAERAISPHFVALTDDVADMEKHLVDVKEELQVALADKAWLDNLKDEEGRVEAEQRRADEAEAVVKEQDITIDLLQAHNKSLFDKASELGGQLKEKDKKLAEKTERLQKAAAEKAAADKRARKSEAGLKAAGAANEKLQEDLTEKDQQLEKAGDPEALEKVQEALAAAEKTGRQQEAKIEKMQKDNTLLKEALDNYKQADAERDQGKGHERE